MAEFFQLGRETLGIYMIMKRILYLSSLDAENEITEHSQQAGRV
jgi:hypothetical protein